MAKKPQAKSKATPSKLRGKTVAFIGKFAYANMWLDEFRLWLERLSAREVKPAASPDYLVVGEGRGGKPPGEVAKIQKQHPSVNVLSIEEFAQLAIPGPDELLVEIARGRRENNDRFWASLDQLHRFSKRTVDLAERDLRKTDLCGAHLHGVLLDGADLRGANTQYTHFGNLRDVNLDGIEGANVYLQELQNCTFRKANLEKSWLFEDSAKHVVKCDFSGANMAFARAERGSFTDCTFVKTTLSDAELERSFFERCNFNRADVSRIHANLTRFDRSQFQDANLYRADFRSASLVNADFRNANLREAVFNGADLTGANVEGADFKDAVLIGANTTGVDFSKAKNYHAPIARTAGPKLQEFARAAIGAKDFRTRAEVDLGEGEHADLGITIGNRSSRGNISAWSRYYRGDSDSHDWIVAPSLEQGLLNLAQRWPNATLRLDTVAASGSKILRGQKLLDLAIAAWAEAFSVKLATPEDLQKEKDAQQAAATRSRDELMKKVCKKGADIWNEIPYQERDRIDLRGVNLSRGKLSNLSMWSRKDLQQANFEGAVLECAELFASDLHGASFQKSNLKHAKLQGCKCEGASFVDADLTSANLSEAKLQGADLTGAKLTSTLLGKAQFDEKTRFPAGFRIPTAMVWKGDGPRPGVRKIKLAKAGSLDFETFVKRLTTSFEARRLDNARKMLKAEKFQLFSDVKDDSVVGVVLSQSTKDRVYSCRLTSEGHFSCCTQNLRPCGGLNGTLCKHLFVLLIGLTKANQLDAAMIDGWIKASRAQKPEIDKDVMSETFIRYKGAEAGEIDWRPTETLPEDFYAM